MRIFVDTADIDEIRQWDGHPWVSGFTTNPTLMRATVGTRGAGAWVDRVLQATSKPVSIDGGPEVWGAGRNVWRKVATIPADRRGPINHTAICHEDQLGGSYDPDDIVSVFAGRIMDTGRDPVSLIDAAKQTGAQVLWASVREPYNVVMAEDAGCDIVTVPPTILRKYLDWHGKPLETVAKETIAQFERDAEGLW